MLTWKVGDEYFNDAGAARVAQIALECAAIGRVAFARLVGWSDTGIVASSVPDNGTRYPYEHVPYEHVFYGANGRAIISILEPDAAYVYVRSITGPGAPWLPGRSFYHWLPVTTYYNAFGELLAYMREHHRCDPAPSGVYVQASRSTYTAFHTSTMEVIKSGIVPPEYVDPDGFADFARLAADLP